ncbi:phosphatase PAP2 family protein [Variovorax sp. PAMC26660]|uniref:phosphatase PAP2 family protein n=1 Tax=Variovorax sp. PAMC26660 TaxID=2762322 RepID=UPI00164E4D2B|nr:phosphatase PAP2 family protein [Variovorax sp. PAMC26660]QNK67174.1 phosphatase PAP2 family protein [Variovorax sp. PAMC26660]
MNTLNVALLHWIAAGEDPDSWVLLAGRVMALWGGPVSATVLLWAGWKKPSERTHLFVVIAGAVAASLLSHALASALNFQRPFVLGLEPGYISHDASGSLPSTHATVMFFVAAAFLMRGELRRVGWVLVVLATLTAWSRVYVGVHFPLDIAAGLLLGLFLAGVLAAVQWRHSDGTAIRRQTRTRRKRAGPSNWRPS